MFEAETHMLIVAGEQIAKCSIPAGSPKFTVVVEFAKLGALVRGGGEGVEDALLLHEAGAQADALTGVLLTQASDGMGCRFRSVECKNSNVI